MADVAPLAIDVDGTFLKTDLRLECLWAGLGRAPGAVLRAMLAGIFHPAERKAAVAAVADLRTDLLPVRPELAALAAEGRAAGREVVLVSSADLPLVQQLAADHGLSDRVFASTEGLDLRDERKAAALLAAYGARGFDFAGDSASDWVVWRHAENALIVGRLPAVERRLIALGKTVTVLPDAWRLGDLLAAMRPVQWTKALLLGLAPLAAHRLPAETAAPLLLAMLVFALASAALYLVGDLLDMGDDRLSPQHRSRALACGDVPIRAAMWAAFALLMASVYLATFLGAGPLALLLLFLAIAFAYALRLKKLRWIDIACRAALNLLRVMTGAVVTGIPLSGHVVLSAFAVFLTLACVGRLRELAALPFGIDTPLAGRAYGRRDRSDLVNMAALGIFGSVLSLWLYAISADAIRLYASPLAILLASLPFAVWLVRLLRGAGLARPDRSGAWRRRATDAALLGAAVGILALGSGAVPGGP